MVDDDDAVVAAPPVATPPTPVPAAPKASATKGDDAPATDPAAFHVTLDEFCRSQSSVPGNSVELLAAFHNFEVRSGGVRDSQANFAERYDAFASKPV